MTSVDDASVIRPAGAGELPEQRDDLVAEIIDLTTSADALPTETIDLTSRTARPLSPAESAPAGSVPAGSVPAGSAPAGSGPADPVTKLRASLPVSVRGRWRRRYLSVVALADAGALLLAVVLVVGLRGSTLRHVHGPTHRLVVVGGLLLLWGIVLAATNAYEGQRLFAGRCNLRRVMQAGATTGFLVAVGSRLADRADLLSFVAFVVPLGVAFQIYARGGLLLLLRRLRRQGSCLTHLVVVGGRDEVERVCLQAARAPAAGWRVIAACVRSEGAPEPIAVGGGVLPLYGPCTAVAAATAARRSGAEAVGVIAGALGPSAMRELAWDLERDGLRLLLVHDLAGIAHGRLMATVVGDTPLLEVRQPVASRWLKSAGDRIFAAALLFVLAPAFLVLAMLVRADSRGPVFFRQTRVGRDGRRFTCWKFRSMYVDAEARLAELAARNEHDGVLFKIREDPRVTRVGRLVRKYSLDELPQLFNVLGGSMSLVGPRPPLPSEVAAYGLDARRRLKVKPGMTGLWQVSGRADLSWEESVRLDLYYVENWSHSLDWHILARTVSAVVAGKGAY
jgi:exopolysaccharide biosynthesis polyprenyl glycosylphosphotransferase